MFLNVAILYVWNRVLPIYNDHKILEELYISSISSDL